MFSNAKCFPISHHLLAHVLYYLGRLFSSVTDPTLGINHQNRRSGAFKGYSPPPDRLYLFGICRRQLRRGVCTSKRTGKSKRLHGEREANRVNCYVKSATVNCGAGRPPYSLPVPEGNSSPDAIFLEAVTHKRLAPTRTRCIASV